MEQHRDEQLQCADCGAAFVFSAAESAVFAERGLTAPKRCKACRRARKDQRLVGEPGRGSPNPSNRGAGGSRDAPRAPSRGFDRGTNAGNFRPRYTGDVNEYRSPMQDGPAAPRPAPRPGAPRWGAQGGGNGAAPPRRGADEYRSPMQDRAAPRPNDRRPQRPRNPTPDPAGNAAPSQAPSDRANRAGARGRAPAPKFPITCDSCGSQAEVPFKPAEGREVYCTTCYKARRAPPAS